MFRAAPEQAGNASFLLIRRGSVGAGSIIRPTGINVVIAVPHESEYPNWFQAWCNNCKRYYSPHAGPHRCTTPGQQTLTESYTRLERWLTPPYTFED